MHMKTCRMAHGASTKATLSFNLDLSHETMSGDLVFAKKPILGKTKYVRLLNFHYLPCCIFFNVGSISDIRTILTSILLIVLVHAYRSWHTLLKYNLAFFSTLLSLSWARLVITSLHGILIFG